MKVGLISLGCDKNRVDAERMLYALSQNGYEITDDLTEAEVIIVNTCAFIEDAKKEAIDNIFYAASLKENGKLLKLVVTGCFATRYAEEVREELAEVDAFVPVANENDIAKIVNDLFENENETKYVCGRILTTPPHYAYLKIADGCNNRCTYCAIPSIRGKYVSEPIEKLVKEAESLSLSGVRELILVAQDTTSYGKDIYGKPSLIPLLKELVKLDFWKIRLLYTYPELVSDELIEFLDSEPKMAKYLDIPMQHADDGILKKMNRRNNSEYLYDMVNRIRKSKNHIAIRSSFIVGFPSETEKEYDKLKEFIKGRLDYAGFFEFSKEEGTPAYNMDGKVSKRVSKSRRLECEKLQCESTILWQDRLLGTEVEVIYEGIDYAKGKFYGRTEYCAPTIDTLVYFTSDFPLLIGKTYKVKIEKNKFHLYGKAVKEDL